MAGESTFSAQITNLVGGATIDEEFCDDAAQDACKEIINQLPAKLKAKCSTITIRNATNGTTLELDGIGDILSVTRLSANSGGYYIPCREVDGKYGDLTNDSTNLTYYATATDPAFWITSNSSDEATLFIKPTPTDAQPANVYHITYPSVDVSASTVEIANFPDEATYLVVLYAAARQLLKFQATMSASFNTSIGTALTAVAAEIGLAKAEVAEIASQTDNSGDIATALTAINTELDKVDDVIVEASTEIDKIDNVIVEGSAEIDKADAPIGRAETDAEGEVNAALVLLKAELDETQGICDLINTQSDSAVTALGNMGTEIGLANAEIDLANPEVDLAKAEILETVTLIDGAIDTASAAVATAVGRVNAAVALANVQFDSAVTNTVAEDIDLAASYVSDGQGYLGEASGHLQEAQGYVNEVNARVAQVNGQIAVANGYLATASGYNQAGAAYLQTAQTYGNQANGFVAAAGAFANELQSKINIANGYFVEIKAKLAQSAEGRAIAQSRLATGSAYLQEAAAIVSNGNSYLAEAQAYIAQANGYASEVSARTGFTSAKMQAVQGYISTASTYVSEATTRLSMDSAKYQWYGDQHAKLTAEYVRGLTVLKG